ncbi:MAG: cupin domain-containing protein [Acidobacteriota bacterium]
MRLNRLPTTLILTTLILTASAPLVAQERAGTETQPAWAAFDLAELAARRDASGRAYLRFLRVPSLSTGIYQLPSGGQDEQRPHDRDEIYFVTEGEAQFTADGEDIAVQPGSILYVKAGVEHRFHSIEKDLTVLVVFAAGPLKTADAP